MPPRNSKTKAFRKYHYVSEGSKKIPIETIYNNILKPETAINNDYEKDFKAYKKRMEDQGIDIQKRIQACIKDDQDGDPRYMNTDWYQDKLKG